MDEHTSTGRIKYVGSDYGIIVEEDSESKLDIFFKPAEVAQGRGQVTLKEGQIVQFEKALTDIGLRATNVIALSR